MARLLVAASFLVVASFVLGKEDGIESLKYVNNVNFGHKLFRNISRYEKNFFFSPLSVSSLMSQIYMGAKGETREEMGSLGHIFLDLFDINVHETYHKLFRQLERRTTDYQLEIANGLLTQVDFEILDEYRNSLQRYYDTLVEEVDFVQDNDRVVQQLNSWVREKTHGKIATLVDQLDSSTRLVLLNAIYFKGTWKTQFDPELTQDRPFYNNGGENSVSAPTMRMNTKFPFFDDYDRKVKALLLPYKGDDISMLVVLPYERNGLERMKKELVNDDLTSFLDNLDTTKVIVSLPKFKFESSRELKEDFKKAGIVKLFDSRADLSGITGDKSLYVSEIIHKAKIEINEEGSEAAAITGGIISNKMLPLPSIINEFNADHPFLYYIVHNPTKVILFMGSVDEL